MRDLGDFSGETREAVDASFKYFGETIRINPDVTEQDLIDWGEMASGVDENGSEALSASKKLIKLYVHADDFENFWATAKVNRQTSADLMDTTKKIMESLTDFPTKEPSSSFDGPSKTAISSADALSLQVQSRYEDQGRGDMAALVKRQREARAALQS